MLVSFQVKDPYRRLLWKRCPVLKEKIQIKRFYKASNIILNEMKKDYNQYLKTGIEIFLTTELFLLPFLKNTEEQFLLNELVLFMVEKEDLNKIKSQKYQITVISNIFRIFVKRVIIPLLLKEVFNELNSMFWHKKSS